MSGKQHMAIGTIVSIILSIVAIYMKIWNIKIGIILVIIGAIIGSYIPDIDAHDSKASQFFNKLLVLLIFSVVMIHLLNININLNFLSKFTNTPQTKLGWGLFMTVTILSKLSPHRIFTHKIFGTSLFLLSVYLMGNKIFFIGFTIGYIMHIIADRFFTKNGEFLKFFEFKLPLTNSKGKLSIKW